jgi:hypothetical protein
MIAVRLVWRNVQQALSFNPRNLQFVSIIALFKRPVRTSQETAASLLQRHVYVLFGAVTVGCDVHKHSLKRFLPMLQQMVPTEPTAVFRGLSGSSAVIAVRRRAEICVRFVLDFIVMLDVTVITWQVHNKIAPILLSLDLIYVTCVSVCVVMVWNGDGNKNCADGVWRGEGEGVVCCH